MSSHVHQFYRKFADEQTPIRLYHEVFCLHEASNLRWESLCKKAFSPLKGWYKFSQLFHNGSQIRFWHSLKVKFVTIKWRDHIDECFFI